MSSPQGTNKEISAFTEGYFKEISNTIEVLANNPDIINAAGDEKSSERALKMYRDYKKVNDNITNILRIRKWVAINK